MSEHSLLVEKYRPTSLDEYICSETLRKSFTEYIEKKDIPHLLLYGDAGSGQTTLAKIFANTISPDNFMYINASDENSVDTVRDKIKQFASSMGFGGLKIIILDEADYLSQSAQAALRNIMETFSKTTRFILTCNYAERIIEPLQSRCQSFNITPPSKRDVAKHIVAMLKSEGVEFDLADVATIVNANYPDVRKTINSIQRSITGAVLTLDQEAVEQTHYYGSILEILKSEKKTKDKFQEIRQLIANNYVRDYTPMFRFLYDNVDGYAKTKVGQVIIIIAEAHYRDAFVIDHEINAMSMFIQIINEIASK